jgi:nitrous oxidase accessory protein NosD
MEWEPKEYHYPFTNNQIIGNLICDNGEKGISLWADFKYWYKSRNNKIIENNFINNKQDAFIENAFLNRWHRNYWNESRFLPKVISGVIQRDYDTREFQWFKMDWRPAIKPYEIKGG